MRTCDICGSAKIAIVETRGSRMKKAVCRVCKHERVFMAAPVYTGEGVETSSPVYQRTYKSFEAAVKSWTPHPYQRPDEAKIASRKALLKKTSLSLGKAMVHGAEHDHEVVKVLNLIDRLALKVKKTVRVSGTEGMPAHADDYGNGVVVVQAEHGDEEVWANVDGLKKLHAQLQKEGAAKGERASKTEADEPIDDEANQEVNDAYKNWQEEIDWVVPQAIKLITEGRRKAANDFRDRVKALYAKYGEAAIKDRFRGNSEVVDGLDEVLRQVERKLAAAMGILKRS